MGAILQKLLDVFYTKKLDIVVIGLENRYSYVMLCYVVTYFNVSFVVLKS
jgi:hypothetical protein